MLLRRLLNRHLIKVAHLKPIVSLQSHLYSILKQIIAIVYETPSCKQSLDIVLRELRLLGEDNEVLDDLISEVVPLVVSEPIQSKSTLARVLDPFN